MKKSAKLFKVIKIGLRDIFLKESFQCTFIIAILILSAIIGGVATYRINEPKKISDEEFSFFRIVTESIYSDGIDDTNMSIRYLYNNFDDPEISIPSESQIKISLDDGQRYIIADFSIPENPIITDHYSHTLQSFLTVIGIIVGVVAGFLILWLALELIEYIIKLKTWFDNMLSKTDEELLAIDKSDDDNGNGDDYDDDGDK